MTSHVVAIVREIIMIIYIANGKIRPDAPTSIVDIVDNFSAIVGLIGHPERFQILHLYHCSGEDDIWEYEIEVELARGVVLTTRCNALELSDQPAAPMQIASEVAVGAVALHDKIDEMAEILHAARIRTRRIFREWLNEGVHVRLIDIRLAPYDQWRGMEAPGIEVIVEALNDSLEPFTDWWSISASSSLEPELRMRHWHLKSLEIERSMMMHEGATGIIDQLALNAINNFGCVAAHLQRLRGEPRFWLPDGTCIALQRGRVVATSGEPHQDVLWSENSLSFRRTSMPESAMITAVGKPVDFIFEHPYVSPDMIIEAASCDFEDHEYTLSIQFSQQSHWFCSASGRIWKRDNPKNNRPRVEAQSVS
jgi:hypothetical protein